MTRYSEVSSAQVATQLRVVVGRLRRQLREVAGPSDLTPSQASALTRLGKQEATTASALAELEGVRPQSMAATLAALDAAGLIDRTADPQDGRRQLLTLTLAGREVFEGARVARQEWLARALADRYSDREREQLAEALTLLERLTTL